MTLFSKSIGIPSFVLAYCVICSSSNAGFIVRDVHSNGSVNNLASAIALLEGSNVKSEQTATRPYINLFDADNVSGEGSGHFSGNLSFPNDTPGQDDNNFAIHATATIFIPEAGIYTFGVNSDDGSRLMIDNGSGFVTVIQDDSIHAPADSFGIINFASAGNYDLDFIYFEAMGQATVELFAAFGTFSRFDPSFRLVGDTANGGLQVVTAPVPEPTSIALTGIGGLFLLSYMRKQRRGVSIS